MAVQVLVFDPMNPSSIEEFEQQLDSYLSAGWEILQALSGNRAGVAEESATFATRRESFHQSIRTTRSSC